MKKHILAKFVAGVALASVAMAGVAGDVAQILVNRSKNGGYFARQVFSAPEKELAEWCAGPKANQQQLDTARAETQQLIRTHEAVSFARIGVFLSDYAYTVVPKGSVRVGDEAIFKLVPMSQMFPGVNCPNPMLRQGVFTVDRVIGHHTGSLLYANGKFIDNIPADGEQPKSESKPTPKSNPVLDL